MDNGRNDLAKALEEAMRAAEIWRRSAGDNSAEYARRKDVRTIAVDFTTATAGPR